MDPADFLKAISSVNSMWSMAAFTIAALLAILTLYVRSAASSKEEEKKPVPPYLTNLLWGGVALVCIMGLAPIAANGLLESQRMKLSTVYHLRVTVLNDRDLPISGAQLRTSVSGEAAVADNGEASVTIARGNLPADGKVTIFADKDSEFLHGRTDLQLVNDPNPSVTIHLKKESAATLSGIVEDPEGHAVPDALVSLPGGESTTTSSTGSFSLSAHAPPGESVTVHVEKAGFQPCDQSHLAGSEPATIVLTWTPAQKTRR